MRIAVIIVMLASLACSSRHPKDQSSNRNRSTVNLPGIGILSGHNINPDTVYTLLENAAALDSFQFDNWEPFLYLKTGQLFTNSSKNAILITCPTDSTYKLEMYSSENNRWIKKYVQDGLEAFPVQFNILFADYNFDHSRDIYIQYTASNGYSMSRGHLLTFDAQNGYLTAHSETKGLANMTPDNEAKLVNSEQVIECSKTGQTAVCTCRNRWINGKLMTVKKDCPCD